MRIGDALEMFLVQLQADGRSAHTIDQYERHVRAFAAWWDARAGSRAGAYAGADAGAHPDLYDVRAIRHVDIAAFLADEATRSRADGAGRRSAKKPTSMNCLRSSVRGFFAYLEGADVVTRNPARLVRRARCGVGPPKALSDYEVGRLMDTLRAANDAAGKRDHALFGLLLTTGIRISSALALRIEDVNLRDGTLELRSPKGGRPQRIYLSAAALLVIATQVIGKPTDPLFGQTEAPHKFLNRRHVSRRLKGWLAKAEVATRASPHSLRHTFATKLLDETRDVTVVQKALLHRSIASTLVYAAVSDRRVDAAIGR